MPVRSVLVKVIVAGDCGEVAVEPIFVAVTDDDIPENI